jgi:hemolysin D
MNALVHHWSQAREALAAEKQRARRMVRTEETDFLPAALEIIERPVSPTARMTSLALLLGLVLTLLWMTFGRIDIVASAAGRLVPGENVKLVQPAQPGVVRAILVRDSDFVRKGQPLVELDPTVSSADALQAGEALRNAQLNAARNRAILSALDGHGLAFEAPEGTSPAVRETQIALARATVAMIQGDASSHDAARDIAIATRGEALTQVAKLKETLPYLDEEIAANELLLGKGFVSKLRVIEMRRQRLATAKDLEIARETARKSEAQIASARGGMAQSTSEARTRILDDLVKAETEARLRQEELIKATQRSRLQRLVSPVDGRVTQLAVHTIGGVVEATKPIMVIVPSGGTLIAEVKLLNKDVGFVRLGQPVAVKIAAFPFTRYGVVEGKVDSISSDAIADNKLGLIYQARITLAAPVLRRGDQSFVLTPGMQATADIKTGRRSILSYLLSPIDEARHDAARER